LRRAGGILNTPFWAKIMMRDWVQHAYILSHGSCSRDCSQLICILFVIGRIVCHITSKMGKTIAKLLRFVPELIMKGREGLNLANSKELLIGTVNVTNFDQMPDSSYW